jgi:hypothetical protein
MGSRGASGSLLCRFIWHSCACNLVTMAFHGRARLSGSANFPVKRIHPPISSSKCDWLLHVHPAGPVLCSTRGLQARRAADDSRLSMFRSSWRLRLMEVSAVTAGAHGGVVQFKYMPRTRPRATQTLSSHLFRQEPAQTLRGVLVPRLGSRELRHTGGGA